MGLNFQEGRPIGLTRALLVAALAASVVLMTLYSNEGEQGPLHAVQSGAHAVLAPLGVAGSSAGALAEDAGAAAADSAASEETLTALRERNAELTQLLTQSEEYRLEAERLQGLLGLKETYQIDGVSGRVIGRSTDAWNQTVTIDVGSADGVESGLTVVGPSGVVGQVISVQPGSATVRLLSDPQSGAAAIIQSSRAEGIVRGSLSGQLTLQNLEANAEAKVGDVVLTSGLGGSYVKGLLIGTIVRIEGSAGDGSRTIYVSPNESTGALEEVMVVFDATGADVTPRQSGSSSSAASSARSSADALSDDDAGQDDAGDEG
ncbi:rod shape-determining protein MreC [Adlercreutzia murintestinalis]|uniref:rod shape-determining protein MreC n=1 Tax=Adlercreutzia murintestinalis TaxID=2941325 RepID=UPI00203C3AD8|nr:rod shape-determining protein MreC [Adlercreutzia murintestinalis]